VTGRGLTAWVRSRRRTAGIGPRPAAEPGPLTGVWARAADTATSVQRRLDELGRPPGPVGGLLAEGREAGARAVDQIRGLCRAGAAQWPEPSLQVPADESGRGLYDRARRLLTAQRAVLHRATLLTMPAAPQEQAGLLTGLRRAVRELQSTLDANPASPAPLTAANPADPASPADHASPADRRH